MAPQFRGERFRDCDGSGMTNSSAFYSQFDEDRILARIFAGKSDGVCVEVGANDGVNGSTTLYFEKQGWRCVLIEPNPALCAEIREKRSALLFECAASDRSGTATLHIAEGAWRADGMSTISARSGDRERIRRQGFSTRPVDVPTLTLDEILGKAQLGGQIDFVTIDVEGHEHEVLQGFSLERWKPTILILEDNSNTEDQTVVRHLAELGYEPFLRTGVNDWFAHRSNKELVNIRNKLRRTTVLMSARWRDRLRRIGWLRQIWRWLKGAGR
jgi:FkbM family methyltransferase